MTQCDPSSYDKGGLTSDLLFNLKSRLDHVVVQVLQMSAMGEQQSQLLARLSDPSVIIRRRQAVAAAALDGFDQHVSELHLVAQLIIRQTETIKCVVRMTNLVAGKLQAPLQSLKRGSHESGLDHFVREITVGGHEAAVIRFNAPENLVALARAAAVKIEDVFQTLEIIEAQVTSLAAAQELATSLLKSRMASLDIA